MVSVFLFVYQCRIKALSVVSISPDDAPLLASASTDGFIKVMAFQIIVPF
jgi:hypothetical protein